MYRFSSNYTKEKIVKGAADYGVWCATRQVDSDKNVKFLVTQFCWSA